MTEEDFLYDVPSQEIEPESEPEVMITDEDGTAPADGVGDKPEDIVPAKDLIDKVTKYIQEQKKHKLTFTLPFLQTNEKYAGKEFDLEFRPGEVTVWGGPNGCGKSMLTTQTAAHLVTRGAKVLLCSYEMQPVKTLERLLRQCFINSNKHVLAETDLQIFSESVLGQYIFLYTKPEQTTWEEVEKSVRGAVKNFECDHIFIDSLMTCVSNDNEYVEVDSFMKKLVTLTKELNIHTHLIAHFRKEANNPNKKFRNFRDALDKDNIKGCGSITNLAANVITMVKNTDKFKPNKNGEIDDSQPDAAIAVVKQRNGSYHGYIDLWFDNYSFCYCQSSVRNVSQPLNKIQIEEVEEAGF